MAIAAAKIFKLKEKIFKSLKYQNINGRLELIKIFLTILKPIWFAYTDALSSTLKST